MKKKIVNNIPSIPIEKGDIFLSFNPWWIGRAIIAVEKFWSKDRAANYGHAGIVRNSTGLTLEALTTIKHGLLSEYENSRLMVVRPVNNIKGDTISLHTKINSMVCLEKSQLGRRYPYARLLLHLIPSLARWVSNGERMVCSELVSKYLESIKAIDYEWAGTNPDMLADYVRNNPNYKIIYETKL